MFRFISALDGSYLGQIDARDATMACNLFLKRLNECGASIADDVIVNCGGRCVAVISQRKNRKPDVMVLAYMRQRCMAS